MDDRTEQLNAIGEAMERYNWTPEREMRTLIALARSEDSGVSIRAIATILEIMDQCRRHGGEMRSCERSPAEDLRTN